LYFIMYTGGVSREYTDKIETAVIDVISFLHVSLGSNRVQIHHSLCSRCPCAYSEVGSVVKMATVFEVYITEEQRAIVRIFVGKRTQCKGHS
jgi:hypothetical protein